jgi:hypothetical protein
VRFHVRLFGFCCLLAFCGAATAAEQPILVARLEFTSVVGAASPYSGLQFLTDDLLMVSNGRSSPAYAIYDVTKGRTVGTGTTCAFTGSDLWKTPRGNILAACPEGLVLYDREFHELARIKVLLRECSRPIHLRKPPQFLPAASTLAASSVRGMWFTSKINQPTEKNYNSIDTQAQNQLWYRRSRVGPLGSWASARRNLSNQLAGRPPARSSMS